jgi:Helix-turn-helix domain
MTERAAFGLELRRARERRGLTLEEISEQTKISAAHFDGLERGDLSHWPSGIFRRAFVRGYAGAVGLDADDLVARFGRVFPEPGDAPRASVAAAPPALRVVPVRPAAPARLAAVEPEGPPVEAPDAPSDLRLALDEAGPGDRSLRLRAVRRRVVSAGIDAALALAGAGLVALVAGGEWFWMAAACIGLASHAGVYAVMETTPGAWLLTRGRRVPARAVSSGASLHRRSEAEFPAVARRHVPRHATKRPAAHAHRARH